MFTDLSIIIVNWKSTHFLGPCLDSIYADSGDIDFEVLVIDNASYDGCDRFLSDHYPQVRFIQSSVNLGFAGANNLAYKQSRGKSLLFLNPDTVIVGQAISTMHEQLCKIPDAGAIGGRLLNSDGTLQMSCVQAFPTLLNQIFDIEVLRHRFPLLSLWRTRPLFERSKIPMPVEVISGACLMVNRHVFESAGLFSDDYFMYAEDTDLCFKIRAVDFVVYYIDSASVIHHGGGSSTQHEISYFADVVMNESLFRFLTKCRGRLYGYLYRITMGVVASIRIMLIISLMALISRRSVSSPLRISLGKWIKIFRWSLGFEKCSRHLIQSSLSK